MFCHLHGAAKLFISTQLCPLDLIELVLEHFEVKFGVVSIDCLQRIQDSHDFLCIFWIEGLDIFLLEIFHIVSMHFSGIIRDSICPEFKDVMDELVVFTNDGNCQGNYCSQLLLCYQVIHCLKLMFWVHFVDLYINRTNRQ